MNIENILTSHLRYGWENWYHCTKKTFTMIENPSRSYSQESRFSNRTKLLQKVRHLCVEINGENFFCKVGTIFCVVYECKCFYSDKSEKRVTVRSFSWSAGDPGTTENFIYTTVVQPHRHGYYRKPLCRCINQLKHL